MKILFLLIVLLIAQLLNVLETQSETLDLKTVNCKNALPLRKIKFSPDAKLLSFINNDEQKIYLINLENQTKTKTTQENLIIDFDFSPDGLQIMSFNGWTRTLDYWNLNGTKQHSFRLESGNFLVKFLNRTQLIGLNLGIVNKYDLFGHLLNSTKFGEDSIRFYGHPKNLTDRIQSETLSKDNQLVGLAYLSGEIQIWKMNGELAFGIDKINTLNFVEKDNKYPNRGVSIEFSPNNKYLASGTVSGNLRLINIDQNKVKNFAICSNFLIVKFTPDSNFVISHSNKNC